MHRSPPTLPEAPGQAGGKLWRHRLGAAENAHINTLEIKTLEIKKATDVVVVLMRDNQKVEPLESVRLQLPKRREVVAYTKINHDSFAAWCFDEVTIAVCDIKCGY